MNKDAYYVNSTKKIIDFLLGAVSIILIGAIILTLFVVLLVVPIEYASDDEYAFVLPLMFSLLAAPFILIGVVVKIWRGASLKGRRYVGIGAVTVLSIIILGSGACWVGM